MSKNGLIFFLGISLFLSQFYSYFTMSSLRERLNQKRQKSGDLYLKNRSLSRQINQLEKQRKEVEGELVNLYLKVNQIYLPGQKKGKAHLFKSSHSTSSLPPNNKLKSHLFLVAKAESLPFSSPPPMRTIRLNDGFRLPANRAIRPVAIGRFVIGRDTFNSVKARLSSYSLMVGTDTPMLYDKISRNIYVFDDYNVLVNVRLRQNPPKRKTLSQEQMKENEKKIVLYYDHLQSVIRLLGYRKLVPEIDGDYSYLYYPSIKKKFYFANDTKVLVRVMDIKGQ